CTGLLYLHRLPPTTTTLFRYTTLFRSPAPPRPRQCARAPRALRPPLPTAHEPSSSRRTPPKNTNSSTPGRSRHRAPHPHHAWCPDRKSTRLNSSHVSISYAVYCLKKQK